MARADDSNIDRQRSSLARSAASALVLARAWAITSSMTVSLAMSSVGHSRVERNAPNPIAATIRPPTGSGTTNTERIPAVDYILPRQLPPEEFLHLCGQRSSVPLEAPWRTKRNLLELGHVQAATKQRTKITTTVRVIAEAWQAIKAKLSGSVNKVTPQALP